MALKKRLNNLHPNVFNFSMSNWFQRIIQGRVEYGNRLLKSFDSQISKFDAIPIKGLHSYISDKILLSVLNDEDPSIVWNKIKNDKRVPEIVINWFEDKYNPSKFIK